jgi:YfiR/HmsC-like
MFQSHFHRASYARALVTSKATSQPQRVAARWLRSVIFTLVGLFASPAINASSSAVTPMSEADWIVAVARFVEWPNTELRDLIVCSPPSGASLMLDKKIVRGLRVVEKRVKKLADAKSCHVLALFSERSPGRWIESTRGLPILTIGYSREFCIYGGVVCIVTGDDGTASRHRINLETLARAGLYARNELLTPNTAGVRAGTGK